MKFKIENFSAKNVKVSNKNESITVNYSGGKVDYICKNYPLFWFTDLNGMGVTADSIPHHEIKNLHGDWYDISIDGNTLHFEFLPRSEDSSPETRILTVTAGDIFFTIFINSKS